MTISYRSTNANTVSTFTIDPENSRVTFTARKRLFFVRRYNVVGRFRELEGSIELDGADPERSHVEATIQAASIDTGNGQRDGHVRSRLFLDVKRSPEITFESNSVTAIDRAAGHYRIDGMLTIRGVSREVSLDTYAPTDQHAGLDRLTFSAETAINRRDFGVKFNSPVMSVGKKIAIRLELEAVRR